MSEPPTGLKRQIANPRNCLVARVFLLHRARPLWIYLQGRHAGGAPSIVGASRRGRPIYR